MGVAKGSPRVLDRCEEDIKEVLEEALRANTRSATDIWLKVLSSYCADKNIVLDLAKC